MDMDHQRRIETKRNDTRIKRRKRRRKGRVIAWSIILFIIGFFGWRVHQADASSSIGPSTRMEGVPADNMQDDIHVKAMQQGNSDQVKDTVTISRGVSDHASDMLSGDDAWQLILVNGMHPMAEGYEPPLIKVEEWYYFDTRAAANLEQMLDDARRAGLSPKVCSAYRSMEKQTTLYNRQVNKQKEKGYDDQEAREKAKTVVAYPGTSEHQLGLAVDIVAQDYQILDEKQADTPEAVWLKENCSRYGFILRYPEGKTGITGVIFEPWHFRYVGSAAAAEIMENGLCLEEYLADWV